MSQKNDDFKSQLAAAYDADAQRRTDNEGRRSEWKLAARRNFADLAEAEGKRTIIELGAGSGVDAAYFQGRGFDVLATDLSSRMVAACKKKGLKATVLDLYDLASLGRKFDAIYSMNVLLHVPKNDLGKVLDTIHNSLATNGIFFCGVYGGEEKETVFTDPQRMNLPRFFSFLGDQTLLAAVSSKFDVINSETIDVGESQAGLHFQSLLLRKK